MLQTVAANASATLCRSLSLVPPPFCIRPTSTQTHAAQARARWGPHLGPFRDLRLSTTTHTLTHTLTHICYGPLTNALAYARSSHIPEYVNPFQLVRSCARSLVGRSTLPWQHLRRSSGSCCCCYHRCVFFRVARKEAAEDSGKRDDGECNFRGCWRMHVCREGLVDDAFAL